jgi:Holliday junction resolvasome RuvABC endonuclease subunit
MFLGIDQSLQAAGFALVTLDGEYVASTTVSVGRDARGPARLARIRAEFLGFVDDHVLNKGLDVLGAAREGYAVKATNRPFDLGMVAGVLEEACYSRLFVAPHDVPPMSLKKFATGNGFADKTKMLYSVKQLLGVDLGDRDDEADAVHLARYARAVHLNSFPSRAAAEAVAKLRAPKRPRVRRTTTAKNI